MSNNDNELDQLWQQQQVQEPNLDKLSKKFKAVRRKQWLYMSIDIGSFLILALWLYFYKETMNNLMLILVSLSTVFSLAATIHLVWLRRFALRNTASNTQAYLQGLKNQYANNIKIAKFSIGTIWMVTVLLVVFFTVAAITQDWDFARAVKKMLIASAFLVGGQYPNWLWANKRIRKYANELEKLKSVEQSIIAENDKTES